MDGRRMLADSLRDVGDCSLLEHLHENGGMTGCRVLSRRRKVQGAESCETRPKVVV